MERSKEDVKVLIADDHAIVRQGLALVIEEKYPEAKLSHAASLAQVCEEVEAATYNLLILDAHFQDGNCINHLAHLKKVSPNSNILIFSSYDEKSYATRFLEAGADGYLHKLSSEEEIEQALEQMMDKGCYYSPTTQKLLVEKMRNPNVDRPLHQLSERELQVAELFAQGLGNLEVSNQLGIKQNTVSTLKKRIFDKLQITNLLELIELVKSQEFND